MAKYLTGRAPKGSSSGTGRQAPRYVKKINIIAEQHSGWGDTEAQVFRRHQLYIRTSSASSSPAIGRIQLAILKGIPECRAGSW